MDSKIFKDSFAYGTATATANTAIALTIPALRARKTRVTNVRYRCGTTAHTVSLMRPATSANATAAVAALGTTIVLDAALTVGAAAALAANDWVVVELSDGRMHTSLVSSWTAGTKTLVLATALPSDVGVALGGTVWAFGLPAEANNIQVSVAASATTVLFDPNAGIFTTGLPKRDFADATYGNRSGYFDPVILHSNNATAQGWIESASGYYAAY